MLFDSYTSVAMYSNERNVVWDWTTEKDGWICGLVFTFRAELVSIIKLVFVFISISRQKHWTLLCVAIHTDKPKRYRGERKKKRSAIEIVINVCKIICLVEICCFDNVIWCCCPSPHLRTLDSRPHLISNFTKQVQYF